MKLWGEEVGIDVDDGEELGGFDGEEGNHSSGSL